MYVLTVWLELEVKKNLPQSSIFCLLTLYSYMQFMQFQVV